MNIRAVRQTAAARDRSDARPAVINWFGRGLATIHRWYYLAATYTGLRAVGNQLRSRFSPLGDRIGAIDGARLDCGELGELLVSIDPRPRPPTGSGEASFGMISLRQRVPRISRLAYRYFCLTSHFGNGHVEVAFYQEGHRVTFYGVRNIARSNARRLGLRRMADRLRLMARDEEVEVVVALARLLEGQGLATSFARADECVDLSVCRQLLHPASQVRALHCLGRMYENLNRKLRRQEQGQV